MWLIYLYNKCIKSESVPNNLSVDFGELLIPPETINKRGWTMGYFYTIGNVPVTAEERNIDYGFQDYMTKKFVDVCANELDHKPKYCCIHGLSSYAVVGELIHKAIEENPKLIP